MRVNRMNAGWSACFLALALGGTGCQPTSEREARDAAAEEQQGSTGGRAVVCEDLINLVLGGEDFAGQTLTVSGVALNDTEGGLVNVGTQETYRSGVYENFISVYDVPMQVKAGTSVRVRVIVESSSATEFPNGKTFVVLESAFLELVQ